jgi:hypothetical protein
MSGDQQVSNEQVMSPFALAAEVKGDELVPKPTLIFEGKGYGPWRMRLQVYLDGIGLWDVVCDGLGEKPAAAEAVKDRRARAIIRGYVGLGILPGILDMNSAKQTLDYLGEVYGGDDLLRKAHLLRELSSLRMLPGMTLEAYIQKSEGLSYELAALQAPVDETTRVLYFVAGLSDALCTQIAPIASKLTESTFVDAARMLRDIDRYAIAPSRQAHAMLAVNYGGRVRGGTARTRGHSDGMPTFCWYCHEPGHIQPRCAKLQAIIEEGKNLARQKRGQPIANFSADLVNKGQKAIYEYLLDSGCQLHIVNC